MADFLAPNRQANDFYRGVDGRLTAEVREDETRTWSLDLSDWLPSGVTISGVSWDPSGVTLVITGNWTTTTVSVTTQGSGTAVVTLTLSNGDERELAFRWLSTDRPTRDYDD